MEGRKMSVCQEIRKAARKFDEAQLELEEILRPYIEDVVAGKAPAPSGMELKKVEDNKEYTFFVLLHEGCTVARIYRGRAYTTLFLAGITTANLWESLIPAYEEWRDKR
jgi:hypothetical protein